MGNITAGAAGATEPLLVSITAAAAALGKTVWDTAKLCDSNVLASLYDGPHRLVRVDSLKAYVADLFADGVK